MAPVHRTVLQPHAEPHDLRPRILDGIIDRLADDQKQVVSHGARKRQRRHLIGHIESHAHVGGVEKLLGRVSQIGHEPVERVVGGIDRPDDRIDAPHQIHRRRTGLFGAGHCRRRCQPLHVAADPVGLHGDLGESGADVVMKIPRDPRPLAVKRMDPLHLVEPSPHPPERHRPSRECTGHEARGRAPRPDVATPIPWEHDYDPDARLAAHRLAARQKSGHAKPVGAGLEPFVEGGCATANA